VVISSPEKNIVLTGKLHGIVERGDAHDMVYKSYNRINGIDSKAFK